MNFKKILGLAIICGSLMASSALSFADYNGSYSSEDDLLVLDSIEIPYKEKAPSRSKRYCEPMQYWRVGDQNFKKTYRHMFIEFSPQCRSWAKVDQYFTNSESSISKGYEVSSSASSDFLDVIGLSAGLSINESLSHTESVGRYIQADENRFSKLGFFTDYDKYDITLNKIYVTGCMYERIIDTVDGIVYAPDEDELTLEVVYKSQALKKIQ